MCGIVGFINWQGVPEGGAQILRAMTDAVHHRGPDDGGQWLDRARGVGFGHRRLSILDLSSAGHQPMHSASGRYIIVYNGEIYNHHDLRAELNDAGKAPAWRGHSDTETLLAVIEAIGPDAALSRLNGMFAFALWDQQDHSLFLARDRLGEKPLYYGFAADGTFLFGSELKSLTLWPGFEKHVDRDALAAYLQFNYVPSPYAIWHGLHKLPPAHRLILKAGDQSLPPPHAYWDVHSIAQAAAAHPLADEARLVDRLETLLMDSVGRRMEADVALGAFLSGGIDSSTIVALMQAQSTRKIRTFSIGFHESRYNEATYAKEVAQHLGTDHTELYVTAKQALDVIPRLPQMWDEPFADSSQIPTSLLCEMTRAHVTVSLSGDGGDELFCGYDRYARAMHLKAALARIPRQSRALAAGFLRTGFAGHLAAGVNGLLPKSMATVAVRDRLPKLADFLLRSDEVGIYGDLISHWRDPFAVVLGAQGPGPSVFDQVPDFPDFRQKMMYRDLVAYLPDDILTKVDRASMAASLEARVPFLDHHVVEFAWQLPMSAKLKKGVGKHILREVLYRHVPQKLLDRPKMGFGVPIEDWLRGPLRDWAEDLLDEKRLREDGFFDPAPIRRLWDEHLFHGRRWHYHLWDILMFQAWWRQQSEPQTIDR
ncbi:asparagine synthetase B [Iodidimonas nitroreducens]|uniref:asparagine synthase (glutamine-hydrolyzing) n=1 Tax=Iodidimonas nitroreducens TaxID=1236968 RepID=A0A5A7N992_9PROT|nr:asparagine synthase (glutamine-hydrolyzing) [Iodidimonas nitroreducens]GAK33539.1 asparagine synthetase [glutamine-hydrolyzing] 1 [alpha proteobacterium Q-1]GER04487.1 asparagine synthetase B [Iodidimonas nitroreducens]